MMDDFNFASPFARRHAKETVRILTLPKIGTRLTLTACNIKRFKYHVHAFFFLVADRRAVRKSIMAGHKTRSFEIHEPARGSATLSTRSRKRLLAGAGGKLKIQVETSVSSVVSKVFNITRENSELLRGF
jgi:hypothetical protein